MAEFAAWVPNVLERLPDMDADMFGQLVHLLGNSAAEDVILLMLAQSPDWDSHKHMTPVVTGLSVDHPSSNFQGVHALIQKYHQKLPLVERGYGSSSDSVAQASLMGVISDVSSVWTAHVQEEARKLIGYYKAGGHVWRQNDLKKRTSIAGFINLQNDGGNDFEQDPEIPLMDWTRLGLASTDGLGTIPSTLASTDLVFNAEQCLQFLWCHRRRVTVYALSHVLVSPPLIFSFDRLVTYGLFFVGFWIHMVCVLAGTISFGLLPELGMHIHTYGRRNTFQHSLSTIEETHALVICTLPAWSSRRPSTILGTSCIIQCALWLLREQRERALAAVSGQRVGR